MTASENSESPTGIEPMTSRTHEVSCKVWSFLQKQFLPVVAVETIWNQTFSTLNWIAETQEIQKQKLIVIGQLNQRAKFQHVWNWFGNNKYQGLSRPWSKLSPENTASTRLAAPGTPRIALNVFHRNSLKYRNDHKDEFDCNWLILLKF